MRRLVTDFRQRLGQGNAALDRVRLAIDEWGIVRDWNPAPDGPGIGPFEHYYTLGDAIAAGRALHELLRSADVVAMANWAQTVNVIAAIKTSRNSACLDPVGHLLALYRAQVGGTLRAGQLDRVRDRGRGRRVGQGLRRALARPDQLLPEGGRRRAAVICPARPGSLPPKPGASPALTSGRQTVPGQPEAVTTTGISEPFAPDRPFQLPRHSITVLRLEKVSLR